MTSGVAGSELERLAAHLDRQEQHLDDARTELDAVRATLTTLATQLPVDSPNVVIEAGEIMIILARLLRHAAPVFRSMVHRFESLPAAEELGYLKIREMGRETVQVRAIYPADRLDSTEAWAHVDRWAAIGEDQRMLASTPTEFTIFGSDAVISLGRWGDLDSGYVIIRDPLHIAAFTAYFDAQWAQSTPMLSARGRSRSEDRALVELLGMGLKDEGIARHLGLGLRTVRRRVAALMAEHNVETRYQLGEAMARSGTGHRATIG